MDEMIIYLNNKNIADITNIDITVTGFQFNKAIIINKQSYMTNDTSKCSVTYVI